MRPPVSAPVLALHGDLDRCLLPETARASRGHVVGPYEFRTIPGVGHFLHEEAPDVVAAALARVRPSGPAMTVDRDRDARGRARNQRPRDDFGRPMPYGAEGSSGCRTTWCWRRTRRSPRRSATSTRATRSRRTRCSRRAGSPPPTSERGLWRALAQICVGLTHAQRRNLTGASSLLSRGSAGLCGYAGTTPYGIGVDRIAAEAAAWASGASDRGTLRLVG